MRKLRILIIDDSEEDVKRISNMLEMDGHQVLKAHNGNDGLMMASTEKPDLILMDIVMPGINGFQATRELTKNSVTKDIPVIMISGKDQETDKAWGIRQGAKAYLTKIIKHETLFSTIKQVVI